MRPQATPNKKKPEDTPNSWRGVVEGLVVGFMLGYVLLRGAGFFGG